MPPTPVRTPKTIVELDPIAGSTTGYFVAIHKPGEPIAKRVGIEQLATGLLKRDFTAGGNIAAGTTLATGVPGPAPTLVYIGGIYIHDADWDETTGHYTPDDFAQGVPEGTRVTMFFPVS